MFVISGQTLAWDERGHDLLTRVAVQDLLRLGDANPALTRPFASRDHMLSHLSNVPDIVWRAAYMSDADRAVNGPTHYINLERVYGQNISLAGLDQNYVAFAAKARSGGIDEPHEVGTAPWRVVQLHRLMVKSLRAVSDAGSQEEAVAATNQALLYAGIMAHFVGDLSNPHHTTIDHDGELTGNAGLHRYFEADVVGMLPVSLEQQVNSKINSRLLEKTVLRRLSESERAATLADASKLIFALVADSHRNLPRLTALDDKYSIIQRSSRECEKAQRKAPQEVAKYYRRFVVERLAIGAATLSRLWLMAWQQAGEPDLSSYQSYDYPVRPDFIAPDYLGAVLN